MKISFEINGREVDPDDIGEGPERSGLKLIQHLAQADVGKVRCPAHGTAATAIVFIGKSMSDLLPKVEGCCEELNAAVTRRFEGSEHHDPFPAEVEICGEEAHKFKGQLFCSNCRRETEQTLQYAQAYALHSDSDGVPYSLFWDMWLIWRCSECESLSLQVTWEPTEWFDGRRYDYDSETIVYPKDVHGMHTPKPFTHMPRKLLGFYNEVITAFNGDLRILCTMGIRSLVEGISDDKRVAKQKDHFWKKIEGLATLGIPVHITENLSGVQEIGNKAVHELVAVDREDLRLAIGLVEEILSFIYDLGPNTRQLRRYRKKRPKRVPGANPKSSGGSQ